MYDVIFADVVATGVHNVPSVLRSTLNPDSFEDVSVQANFTVELVVETSERLVGAVSEV